jgi:hypothetical protein
LGISGGIQFAQEFIALAPGRFQVELHVLGVQLHLIDGFLGDLQ